MAGVIAGLAGRQRRTFIVAMAVTLVVTTLVGVRMLAPATAISGGSPYEVPHVVDTNPDPAIVETTIVADETSVDIGNGVTANTYTFNGSIPGPQFHLTPGQRVVVHFENRLEDEPTGIHWHGIELSNSADGSPLTQNQVQAGDTYLYDFVAPRPGIYWYHPHHEYSKNQIFKGLYGLIVVDDPNNQRLVDDGVLPAAAQTRPLVLSDITVCKKPGQNDQRTYNSSQPWVGGATLPQQPAPWPAGLCEAPYDNDGTQSTEPLDEGDVPNSPHEFRTNEGQTVLTNGKNVGARAGRPESPGALSANAATLDVQPGQGLRLHLLNAAATRFFRLHLTSPSGADIPIVRVGGEGGLLDRARVEGTKSGGFNFKYPSGSLLIAPGDRADVVIAFPQSAAGGVATLWTEDFQRTGGADGSQGWANLPTVPVAHFNVTGEPASPTYDIGDGTPLRAATGDLVEALGPPTATLLNPATFGRPGMSAQNMRFSASFQGPNIDNVIGSHDYTVDYAAQAPHANARWAKLGDTLELTMQNALAAHHTFHLHGFSFQPLTLFECRDLSGRALPNYTFPDPEFVDNLDIPGQCALRYRVRLDDRPLADGSPGGGLGRWVIHCHIFFHHHQGMASEIIVVREANGNERAYADADRASTVGPDPGATVSMTGTYSDPEGDPVTLTASAGTVVQGPEPGRWTWTGTAEAAAYTVYVTATDAGGRAGQAVFTVRVGNAAPSLTASQRSVTVSEGETAYNSGTVSDDPNGDAYTLAASAGTLTVNGDGTWSWSLDTTDGPDDSRTVKITASDGMDTTTVRFRLTVNDVPTAVALTAPAASGTAVVVGSSTTVTASVSDPGDDPATCRFDWDDGKGFDAPAPPSDGVCSQTRTLASSGTFTVRVVVNGDGSFADLSTLVVVYDPTGHVSGDGSVGSATFHTNVKYKRGANVPNGKTTFTDTGFSFEAKTYDWLVVSGARGHYGGTGTVNGVGGYRFLLTVVDVVEPPPVPLPTLPVGPKDGLRLKVWDPAPGGAVVYDNFPSWSDDMDHIALRPISGGDIAVTTK